MSMNSRLQVELVRGELVIRIGISTLAFAFEHSEPNSEFPHGYEKKFEVTDKREFAKEVLRELTKEQEDGTTPVHLLLDKAFEDALNNGAQGIQEITQHERSRKDATR